MRSSQGKKIVARYDYTDETGNLLSQVVRFEPKTFRPCQPDGKGDWIWSMKGVRRVLYRLTGVIEAVALERTIFIAEGEKAVDALVKLGVSATCSPGGAEKWCDQYSQHLHNANVVILPDNDEAGERHCEAVARSLAGIATSVRVLRLPEVPAKGDPYDWVKAGGTIDQLSALVERHAVDASGVNALTAHRSSGYSLISRRASEIKPERVEWLWPGRIAKGKTTCIAGEPGTGKSQLSIATAAAISAEGNWPVGEGRAPLGSVIIFSAEDGAADTIVPRLIAAGANRERVHIVSAVNDENGKGHRSFNLQADLEKLEKKIAEVGDVALVVIDPISSYMGKTDSHKNADVRGVLEPIAEMADRTRVAVLTVTHFNKANGGAAPKALHKFIGSIAFVAQARAAFVVLEDPKDRDRRLFLHAKNNLAESPQGLAFRLEQVIVGEGIATSHVQWQSEPITKTADEVLAGEAKTSLALAEAKDFLQKVLADGPLSSKQIDAEAEEAGIAKQTLRRAKANLGVRAVKGGMQAGWAWTLPKAVTSHEHAQLEDMGTFGTDEHLR